MRCAAIGPGHCRRWSAPRTSRALDHGESPRSPGVGEQVRGNPSGRQRQDGGATSWLAARLTIKSATPPRIGRRPMAQSEAARAGRCKMRRWTARWADVAAESPTRSARRRRGASNRAKRSHPRPACHVGDRRCGFVASKAQRAAARKLTECKNTSWRATARSPLQGCERFVQNEATAHRSPHRKTWRDVRSAREQIVRNEPKSRQLHATVARGLWKRRISWRRS